MTIRVLFVDDEEELLEAACEYACAKFDDDVELITATSAQEALTLIEGNNIEAIISDYQMDFMDGLELLEMVRNEDKRIPFIIFTRHSREEIAIQALNLGATFYLKKDSAHIKAQFHELCKLIIHAVEKTRAEKKINELQKRIRFIDDLDISLDSADSPSVALDIKGNIIIINKAMCNLLRCKRMDVLGTNWFKTFVPEDRRKEVSAVFEEMLKEKVKVQWYTNPVITTDKEELMLRWHNTIIRNREGNIIGTFSAGEDVTGRMELEDELREQRDELSFFARTVSHDLHNKLSVLAMYNSLEPRPSQYTKKINMVVVDMAEYLDNLHYLARVGKKNTDKDIVNLNNIVNKVRGDFCPFVEDMEIIIHDLPKIRGHYTHIEQIFHNIIMNIISHAEATKITIWCKFNTNNVKVFIRDNGKGIAPTYQRRIRAMWKKEKFHDTTYGLGLLIVKRVIEDHGGTVEFSSGHKNGTTFRLTFPLDIVVS